MIPEFWQTLPIIWVKGFFFIAYELYWIKQMSFLKNSNNFVGIHNFDNFAREKETTGNFVFTNECLYVQICQKNKLIVINR